MESLSKVLEGLKNIRDPLAFWSLVGILATWLAISLIRNPKIFEIFVTASKDKTSAKSFFKLMRTLLIAVFITLWLALALAVIAPLASEMLVTHRSDTRAILSAIDLQKKVDEALAYYDQGDTEHANMIFEEVIHDPRVGNMARSRMAASYFNERAYDRCAVSVVARAKYNREQVDLLWSDMWFCLRRYALATSEFNAIGFIDDLKKDDPYGLASRLWALLPADLALALPTNEHHSRKVLSNIYNRNDDTKSRINAIKSVLESDVDDPFRAFGYYAIGEYENALASDGAHYIEPVILFAIGYQAMGLEADPNEEEPEYDIWEDSWADESSEDTIETVGDNIAKKDSSLQLYLLKIQGPAAYRNPDRAEWAFQELMQRFPDCPMSDEAANLSAQIAMSRGDPLRALDLYEKSTKLGNNSDEYFVDLDVRQIFDNLPADEQIKLLSRKYYANDSRFWWIAARSLLRAGRMAEAEEISLRAFDYFGVGHVDLSARLFAQGYDNDGIYFEEDEVEDTSAGQEAYFNGEAEDQKRPYYLEDLAYVVLAARELSYWSANKTDIKGLVEVGRAFRKRRDYRSALKIYEIGLQSATVESNVDALLYGKIVALQNLIERVNSYSQRLDVVNPERVLNFLVRLVSDAQDTALQVLSFEGEQALADDTLAEYVCLLTSLFLNSWDGENKYGMYSSGNPAIQIAIPSREIEAELVELLGIIKDRYRGANAVDNALFCWARTLNAMNRLNEALPLYAEVATSYSQSRLGRAAKDSYETLTGLLPK